MAKDTQVVPGPGQFAKEAPRDEEGRRKAAATVQTAEDAFPAAEKVEPPAKPQS